MSNSRRGPAQLSIAPEMPRGEVVGRYRTYAQAQKAVDYMADEHFPVAMVSIIGSDLKSVEQVTGRLSYPRVALQGALNGLVFGAFFGLLMSLLGGANMASSLVLTMILGGAFWMLMATITYAMSRGKRDFTSTSRIVAGSYEVLAAPEVAGQARQVLNGMGDGHPVGPGMPNQGFRGAAGPQTGQAAGPGAAQGGQYHGGPQRGGPDAPRYGAPVRGEQGQNGHPGVGVQGEPVQGDPRRQDASPGFEPSHGQLQPGDDQQQDTNRSAKFPDLPDGRPQYGIRLDPSDTAPAGEQPAPHPSGNDTLTVQPTGETPDRSAGRAAPWTRPGTPDASRAGGSTPHTGQDDTTHKRTDHHS